MNLGETLTLLEAYDMTLVVFGLGVLGVATLLHRFEGLPFSFPILSLAFGYVCFALPLGLTPPDPVQQADIALHLTELGVIISLMGVGLKIDRLPNLRSWSTTWRMLAICMPLTIIGVTVLGWWWMGLSPAAAVLLGAALAPTDPVLAADVQVGEPDPEREDEVKFALTSEAGLNDSLAFPFTYLALFLFDESNSSFDWLGEWLLIDVFYRITVGVAVGTVLGWGLSQILLKLSVDTEQERMRVGVGALAATLLLYGATECVDGYGFLAVFIGGLTIRHREHTQQAHRSLHTFAEQSEQMLMTGIVIALGGAIAGGLLESLTWQAVAVGVAVLFVIRPVAGVLALIGNQWLSFPDRLIVSFFGIRGIGSLYYLAYALHKRDFAEVGMLWATCGFTVTLSIAIHGATASPVLKFRDRLKSDTEAGQTT